MEENKNKCIEKEHSTHCKHSHEKDPNYTEIEDKPAVDIAKKIEKQEKGKTNTTYNEDKDRDKVNKEGVIDKTKEIVSEGIDKVKEPGKNTIKSTKELISKF